MKPSVTTEQKLISFYFVMFCILFFETDSEIWSLFIMARYGTEIEFDLSILFLTFIQCYLSMMAFTELHLPV